jgi:hypothetical protein
LDDYRLPVVQKLLASFQNEVENARKQGCIDNYRLNHKEFVCFTCQCGQTFPNKRHNAVRHCKNSGCDVTKIKSESAMKLRCGRYVTSVQVKEFFGQIPRAKQQFDYAEARKTILPFLKENEKHEHTYTHMYLPLIQKSSDGGGFVDKIVADHDVIHGRPDPVTEPELLTIHIKAEEWLLHYAQKNILMVPGHLRAALQTFDASEVNDVVQNSTFTLQHNPQNILPILKKLLSFAYKRDMFVGQDFDVGNDFAISDFLKDLLLETPPSVGVHPFLVEFGLMYAFRVDNTNDDKVSMSMSCVGYVFSFRNQSNLNIFSLSSKKITMISCDTLSSVLSKLLSVCKAGVCSTICSFKEHALVLHGP